MASWQSTWDNAELTIFGFFQTLLGGTYEVDAFIGELPKDFEYASVDGVWMVGMEGGGTPLDFDQNINTPGGWVEKELGVRFDGIWNTRDQAKRVAGQLMDALPITENAINGVRRLRPTEEPMIERGIVERAADQSLAGDMRVWRVACPMLALITRTEA